MINIIYNEFVSKFHIVVLRDGPHQRLDLTSETSATTLAATSR